MHQNDNFIVMSSQTLLHVSAYQRHHQGAHMILTSCLYEYISVHYRKNLLAFMKIYAKMLSPITKRGFIQAFMAGVAQLMVFLFQTLFRIRSFTVMFQRNMLPPSSGWLILVQVVA
jgi:hypothetical protein